MGAWFDESGQPIYGKDLTCKKGNVTNVTKRHQMSPNVTKCTMLHNLHYTIFCQSIFGYGHLE